MNRCQQRLRRLCLQMWQLKMGIVLFHRVRLDFTPTFAPVKKRLWLKVEEGSFDEAGNWKMARIWNGDQTDYGLNLKSDENVLLKVTLTTF